MKVMLDTGALGGLTAPAAKVNVTLAQAIEDRLRDGTGEFLVPEIVDYELRRKLLHIRATSSVARLDALEARFDYVPITTAVMREAARLWADARHRGVPTAPDQGLDGDVILAAQALSVGAIVWTRDVRHLSLFVTTFDIDTL